MAASRRRCGFRRVVLAFPGGFHSPESKRAKLPAVRHGCVVGWAKPPLLCLRPKAGKPLVTTRGHRGAPVGWQTAPHGTHPTRRSFRCPCPLCRFFFGALLFYNIQYPKIQSRHVTTHHRRTATTDARWHLPGGMESSIASEGTRRRAPSLPGPPRCRGPAPPARSGRMTPCATP